MYKWEAHQGGRYLWLMFYPAFTDNTQDFKEYQLGEVESDSE
jgi:hypothetical protein